MKKKLSVLIVALLLLSVLVHPSLAQSGVSGFTHIITEGYVLAGSYVKATSYVESTTYAKVGTFERLVPASTVVVTSGGTITPTGSYQPLSSAGTVGTSAIVAGTAGDLLYLINTSNTTITLTDTGTLKLGGNRALGQYDTLTLQSDGTNWIERAYTNN